MCIRCHHVLVTEFPQLMGSRASIKEMRDHLLWGMTAFPFADADYFVKQVQELAAAIRPHKRGWIRRFWRESRRIDDETTAILRKIREREEKETDATTLELEPQESTASTEEEKVK